MNLINMCKYFYQVLLQLVQGLSLNADILSTPRPHPHGHSFNKLWIIPPHPSSLSLLPSLDFANPTQQADLLFRGDIPSPWGVKFMNP